MVCFGSGQRWAPRGLSSDSRCRELSSWRSPQSSAGMVPAIEKSALLSYLAHTAVILLAVLMPMRIAGRWLVWRPQNGQPRREKAQFSLLSMMEMTAGVGVLAALSKLALAPSDMPRRELTLFLLLSPALSSIVLLMSWALLRNRFRWLLFCAAVVASAATAVLTNAIVGDSRNDTTDIILTHAALLIGYLVVCRLCGYRLVRAEQRRTDHAM